MHFISLLIPHHLLNDYLDQELIEKRQQMLDEFTLSRAAQTERYENERQLRMELRDGKSSHSQKQTHQDITPYTHGSFHQVWGMICDGVNCYIRKCTIYYPWLWLLINIFVISYWRWRDWFNYNFKNNCECALIIKDYRWYIYGCNNWRHHKSCPNLVEWPI